MNARLKLVGTGILLCMALGLTAFCAVQTIQAFQRFEQDRKLTVSGDVSTIRSWMTVPYIAHFYNVPESYLEKSLHIPSGEPVRRIPLYNLATSFKRPLNSLINDIQHAILNYRKQHTRAGGTAERRRPAPTLYALRGRLHSRVRTGLRRSAAPSTLVRAPVVRKKA